mmetsp:Transcript_15458/g.19627  ORF Transcript_15458/g.19627 Transcript_15458/m.19627 type:complete len:329 (-) Transcript_15458:35-1021(-)
MSSQDKFKYIFIPCSASEPITTNEESKEGGLSDDYLAKRAKEYFFAKSNGAARAKALDEASPEDRKRLAQQVRNQYASSDNADAKSQLEKMDDEMLINLLKASQGSATCEITALTVPTPLNNYRGVSMYGDDNAKNLNLPLNERATAILKACGHQSNSIHGDVFVGRYHDNEAEDIWERVDFDEAEVQGDLESKEWVKKAKQKGGGGGIGTAAASLSGMMNGAGGGLTNNVGEENGYKWSQTEDEVEIKFSVPAGTKAKYCKVKFGSKTLRVTVAGQTFCDGETWGPIIVDESTYTIQDDPESESGRELCISLGKKSNEHWNYAVMKK